MVGLLSPNPCICFTNGSLEKKEKKRKRDAEKNILSADPETSSSKKKKKKRKKLDGVEQSLLSTSLLSPIPTSNPSPEEVLEFFKKHSITIHTPPSYLTTLIPVIHFSQLQISSELLAAFKGFKEPTPIQACAWPPALRGQDVVGIAETGSGKTLAFGIPALSRLLTEPTVTEKFSKSKSTVTVLVVAPTRELALQTHDTLSSLGAPLGIASVAVFGGVDKGPQVKSLANANKDGKTTRIIVGTPGRILDLVNDGACNLSKLVLFYSFSILWYSSLIQCKLFGIG